MNRQVYKWEKLVRAIVDSSVRDAVTTGVRSLVLTPAQAGESLKVQYCGHITADDAKDVDEAVRIVERDISKQDGRTQ